MKKALKIVVIAAAVLLAASVVGLMITGLKIGWVPLHFCIHGMQM